MATVHLLISGKVQGVFYRASAKEKADELQLTGFVQNTANGQVEAVASGDDKAVEQFIEWCKKGPKRAVVQNVAIAKIEAVVYETFVIKR